MPKQLRCSALFWLTLVTGFLPLNYAVDAKTTGSPVLFTVDEAYERIDPIIGTSGRTQGNVVPAASVPFGNMLLVPETRAGSAKCKAPYYYEDSKLRGVRFSHWISGSCTQDYGSFTILPHLVNVTRKTLNGEEMPPAEFSTFSHGSDEFVEPAHVVVNNLFHGRMNMSFTAMSHSGIIRLRTGEPGEHEYIMIRLIANSRVHKGNANETDQRIEATVEEHGLVICGSVVVRRLYLGVGRPTGFEGHISLTLPLNPVEFGYVSNGLRVKCPNGTHGQCVSESSDKEFYALYKPTVLFEMIGGVSFVSPNKAAENVLKEVGKLGNDFDSVVEFSRLRWKQQVGKVLISNEDNSKARSFYTALYRTMLLPREFSDVDGEYPGFANTSKQRAQNGEVFFSDFSTWDTFRALHPLQTVLNPTLSKQFGHSLISMGQQGGWLPIFPAWNSYTDEMIGDHAGAILGDFIQKGILQGTKTAEAYMLGRKNAMNVPEDQDYILGHGRRCIKDYLKLGYVPVECVDKELHRFQQSSRTIEYSLDDAVLASVACALGQRFLQDCKTFQKRANNFRNVMDPSFGFVNGRHRNGSFVRQKVDPTKPSRYLTEGTPWQWTLAPMHNILGLLEALDISEAKLLARLRQFFDQGLDDHGNEPGHHVPFLFNQLKAYSDTQRVVNNIIETQYHVGATGLKGNDDCGQMSAWLVLSMLGLYQVSPHRPVFEMTTPFFHRADILLDSGKTFSIRKSVAKAIYSTGATLNGKCVAGSVISYDEIMSGGVLFFESSHIPPKPEAFSLEACVAGNHNFVETKI